MPRKIQNPALVPDLAGLSEREIEAARLIGETGMSYTNAFKAAGYPESSAKVRASEMRNTKAGAKFRLAVRHFVSARMVDLAGKALDCLEAELTGPNAAARVRAAVELLDRAQFSSAPQIVQHTHDHAHSVALSTEGMSLSELEDLAREQMKLLSAADKAAIMASLVNDWERSEFRKLLAPPIDVVSTPVDQPASLASNVPAAPAAPPLTLTRGDQIARVKWSKLQKRLDGQAAPVADDVDPEAGR